MSRELLDHVIKERRDRQERDRQLTLQKVHQWLNDHAVEYGIHRAFIFGSLTRPRHFHDRSECPMILRRDSGDRLIQVSFQCHLPPKIK
jgi:hypothetical protein